MFKNTIRRAALIAAATVALVPVTAVARDRDDYRRGYSGHERHEAEERWEHGRGRGGLSFGFSFGTPARRYYAPAPYYNAPAPANGYYDQFGNWHPYAPAGYYDQYGNWIQQ